MPCDSPNYSCGSLLSVRPPSFAAVANDSGFDSAGHSAPPYRPDHSLIVRLFYRAREAFAHRRQRRALSKLDGRLLKDIGVSRPEALQEARKPFWK
jgi:uncharacterized protein YjiS (DUF1127 family)